ncbi:unnamed protein product [Brassica oleracea]|uniref:(rape) hypothetical protein n=1 Tax=Brassica napus TaxID=3708 RepID=A0A816HXU8_BRANA|nr:unnamed protein product [Brassica napus]
MPIPKVSPCLRVLKHASSGMSLITLSLSVYNSLCFMRISLSAVRALVPCPCGGISIYAYVDNDEFDYEDARVLITVVRNSPADKFSRLAKMTMDFLLWSIDNPADPHGTRGPNLLLISKLLQDDELNCLHKLDNLSTNGHNVFLTSEKIPRKVNYVHLLSWQDLSAVGKLKSREDTHY